MNSTFQLPRGIKVPNLSGIHEAYSIRLVPDGYHQFTVNVSAENIHRIFCRLAAKVKEPGYLVLETGSDRDVERQLRKTEVDPFHIDIFYLNGLKWDDARSIIDSYTELFVHDGIICFGFASHKGLDEVFVAPYKIFTIFTQQPDKYDIALKELGFAKVDLLKTVCDNFSQDSPGERNVIPDAAPSIWGMIEELKKKGLYLANRREE